jgi:hypothetical protein
LSGEQGDGGIRGEDWERQEEKVLDALVDEVMGQVRRRDHSCEGGEEAGEEQGSFM